MTGRRGEDSIYWHAKKGCYVGVISLGYNVAGKRRRRTVMAKTKAVVQDKLKALHRELDEGTQTSPSYTVEQAVQVWLASLDLAPDTIKNYTIMAKHVTGTLGARRLRDLTPLHVQAFLDNLPLSTRSKKLVHKILRDAIQYAMIAGLAGRNVAAIVNTTPRGREGRPSRSLSLEQAQAVLEAARGKRLYAYVILCLMTGIRTEEARALTWAHVNLNAGTVCVWRFGPHPGAPGCPQHARSDLQTLSAASSFPDRTALTNSW